MIQELIPKIAANPLISLHDTGLGMVIASLLYFINIFGITLYLYIKVVIQGSLSGRKRNYVSYKSDLLSVMMGGNR